MFRVARGKWVSFLVMVLVVSLLIPAASAAAGGVKGKPEKVKLQDIQGHWGEQVIEKMAAKGFITGYEDLKFRPSNQVTHQEVIAMLVRAMGLESDARVMAQTGVQLNLKNKEQLSAWASGYMAAAVENGLVLPAELKTIIPNKPAKRGEVAAYLARVLIWAKLSTAGSSGTVSFRDAGEISAELMAYVSPVYTWGLMLGDNQRKFQPNKPVTRAEMAIILERLGNLLENELDEEQWITGTIKAIILSEEKIRIEKQGGTQVSIAVAEEASIYRNNRRASLEDLKVGDLVEVMLNADSEATYIAATAPNVIVTVNGKFKSANTDNRTVRLTLENGSEAVYQLADGAQIRLNGKAATLVDLREGDMVKLSLRDGQAIKVEARRNETSQVEGTVVSITVGATPQITIKKSDNRQATYPLAADAQIRLDGQTAALPDLKPGYAVKLTLRDNEAIKVEARKDQEQVRGTISAVTLGSPNKVTVKRGDNTTTVYTMGSSPEITLDSNTARLADLLPGYQAEITLMDGKVSKLVASSREVEIQGTIRGVTIGTPASLTVLRSDGIETTFPVAGSAEVKLDGSSADLAQLLGLEARLRLRDHRVIKAEATTITEVTGSVVSINLASPSRITVRKDDGQQVTFTLADDVEIEVDGQDALLSMIKNGYRIKLSIRDGKVVEIEARSTYGVEGGIHSLTFGDNNQISVVKGSVTTTYDVASNAVIKIDDDTKAFTDLRPGWDVELTISVEGNKVIRIEAETP